MQIPEEVTFSFKVWDKEHKTMHKRFSLDQKDLFNKQGISFTDGSIIDVITDNHVFIKWSQVFDKSNNQIAHMDIVQYEDNISTYSKSKTFVTTIVYLWRKDLTLEKYRHSLWTMIPNKMKILWNKYETPELFEEVYHRSMDYRELDIIWRKSNKDISIKYWLDRLYHRE